MVGVFRWARCPCKHSPGTRGAFGAVVPITLASATGDDEATLFSGSGEGKFVSTLPLQYGGAGVGFRV